MSQFRKQLFKFWTQQQQQQSVILIQRKQFALTRNIYTSRDLAAHRCSFSQSQVSMKQLISCQFR